MDKKDILPYHLYNHKGNFCLINIEKMQANPVDKKTAIALERFAEEPETPLTSDLERSLLSLGLFADSTTKETNTKAREPYSISNMALLLTQSCNLRCIYCYGEGGEYGMGGSMEENTALRAVDWLIEQSGNIRKINIIFFGGEPFLNFSLMKRVVNYAEERTAVLDKTVGFSVTTNATLLDDEKISFIKEHNIHIVISIDGPEEIQDIQRPFAGGRGSYDIILPKIKKLLEVMPGTRAHAVLLDDSKTSIIKDHLEQIGFSEVTIMPASASLFDEKSNKTMQPRKLNGVYKELEVEADELMKYIKNRDAEALNKVIQSAQLAQCMLSFLHNTKKLHACGAGLKYAAVSCSGDIYLCHRFVGMDNYKLGNIFNRDINREIYQESPVTQMKECRNCFARYYCAGGCRHDNASSCGSDYTPSMDMCLIRRREVELAAGIVSSLDTEDHAFLKEYKIFPPKPCPLDF